MAQGFKRPTFIERFFAFLHIPYFVGCLLLATILGPPGSILSAYVQNNNLNEAVSRAVYLFNGVYLPFWQGVAGLCILYGILFYLLYTIRYMRLKLEATEPLFLSLLPEGEETVNKVFSRVSKVNPPILLGSMLSVVIFLTSEGERNIIVFCCDMASTIYLIVALPFFCIVFCTFVWVYYSSIRGLHELGKKPLKLKSFHQDKLLGLKPIGLLSLFFAIVYFGGMSLLALFPVLESPYPVTIFYGGLLSLITILGVVFFILPLLTFHNRMVEEKQRELDALHEKLEKAMVKSNESRAQASGSSVLETDQLLGSLTTILDQLLGSLTTILVSDIFKREIKDMSTWPFDMPLLRRFLALLVSIDVAIIIVDFILKRIM
jgi:hypothetical protein